MQSIFARREQFSGQFLCKKQYTYSEYLSFTKGMPILLAGTVV